MKLKTIENLNNTIIYLSLQLKHVHNNIRNVNKKIYKNDKINVNIYKQRRYV